MANAALFSRAAAFLLARFGSIVEVSSLLVAHAPIPGPSLYYRNRGGFFFIIATGEFVLVFLISHLISSRLFTMYKGYGWQKFSPPFLPLFKINLTKSLDYALIIHIPGGERFC